MRERLEEAATQIRYISGAGASTFSEIRAARQEYQQALEALRVVPGFESMQRELSIETLTNAVPEETLACYLLTTKYGTLILLADRRGCEAVWRERLNDIRVGRAQLWRSRSRKQSARCADAGGDRRLDRNLHAVAKRAEIP